MRLDKEGGGVFMSKTILEQAAELTSGDRNQAYGDASVEFNKVATVWSALLGTNITGPQVALCMAGLKLVREAYKHKEDNLVDACGYLHLVNKMWDKFMPIPENLNITCKPLKEAKELISKESKSNCDPILIRDGHHIRCKKCNNMFDGKGSLTAVCPKCTPNPDYVAAEPSTAYIEFKSAEEFGKVVGSKIAERAFKKCDHSKTSITENGEDYCVLCGESIKS